MERGGRMQGGDSRGIVELARWAAAAARTERAARAAAMRPPWVRNNYNGVHRRKNRYYAVIWNVHTARIVWLGSYATPEEAAYAYDAAARATRGHRAKPNFPAPAWPRAAPAPAREEVATKLVLALPTPTPAAREVAAQLSFDNWLLAGSAAAAAEPQDHQLGAPAAPPLFPHQQQQQPTVALPPFTQFFYPAGQGTAAAAAANGGAAVVNPASNPGAYVLTPQNVQMSPAKPASSELSSAESVVYASASQFFSAAAAAVPTRHRELPVSQADVSDDLSVVEDNSWMFIVTDDGASSSAAPPQAPRLTLDLLLQFALTGRGGQGGAQ